MDDLTWLRRALPLALSGVVGAACDRGPGPAVGGPPVPASAVSALSAADTSARPADGAASAPDAEPPHPPSGEWCGDAPAARRLAYPESPVALGCPRFLDAEEKPADAGDVYDELPHSARAFLDEDRTRLVQVQSATRCCYRWREKSKGGLPLAEGGLAFSAGPSADPAWGEPLPRALAPAPPGVRARAARYWLEQALIEHASVAQFSRLALRLLALGAPPALVAEAHRAAADEVRHARLCFSVAGSLGAGPVGPGPLAAPPPTPRSWAGLALDALDHGLGAEAAAALLARGAARAAVPALRRPLAALAEDERRHVALAARLLLHAVRVSPEARAAVAARLAGPAGSAGPPPPRRGGRGGRRPGRRLAGLGLPGAAAERRARAQAWHGLAAPLARAALAQAPARAAAL